MTILRPVRKSRRQSGFTLIELTISIGLLGTIMALMYQTLSGTIDNRNVVQDSLRGPKVANAILAQIFKDFRYIYWGGFTGNAGFRGKAVSRGGKDADQVSFVTTRPTRTVGSEDDGVRRSVQEERDVVLHRHYGVL